MSIQQLVVNWNLKQVLKKHIESPQGLSKGNNNKGAGDLRIWIYMFNKEGTPYNIGVGVTR